VPVPFIAGGGANRDFARSHHSTVKTIGHLLANTLVCYKPDMRKWMRERLKRRKKAESIKSEGTPTPLQPAYFNPEPVALPAEQVQADAPEPQQPELRESSTSAPEVAVERPTGGERPRRRRRRGRGRGGAGGNSQAIRSTQAAAPTLSGPSIPASGEVTEPFAPGVIAASTAVSRMPRGVVVLAIGLPGSGKSSWFKRHNIAPLSSDLLRVLLFDDPTEQRFQELIFSNLRSMLRARLIARRPTNYVDATNLTPHERQSWIKLAKDFGYEVQAVYFDVPLEVCLERNHRRQRVVSEDVMRRMAAKLRPPSFEEGFTKITVVKLKQKPE
jgi:predicted kinase